MCPSPSPVVPGWIGADDFATVAGTLALAAATTAQSAARQPQPGGAAAAAPTAAAAAARRHPAYPAVLAGASLQRLLRLTGGIAVPPGLLDLSDDLLERILGLLPQSQLRRCVPLVCTRLNDVQLRLWHSVALGFGVGPTVSEPVDSIVGE